MPKLTWILTLAMVVAVAGFLFAKRPRPAGPGIAEIVKFENSVRVRPSHSLRWSKAYAHQPLAPDDAVYADVSSTARVILKHGAILELSENTLLEIDAREVPKLGFGNLRLSLQGNLTLNLGGRLAELHGQDSEIQIFIEDGGVGRLRLLSGSAALKKFHLEKGKVASLDRPDVAKDLHPILSARVSVEARQESNELFYKDKIEDLYQRGSTGAWVPRATRDPMVLKPATLRWRLTGLPARIYVQVAPERDFGSHPLELEAEGEELELKKVFLGNNFWRVSADRKNWSEAYFKVSPLPAPGEPPRLIIRERRFSDVKSASFPIDSSTGYRGYLVDVATLPLFPANVTETTWLTDAIFLFNTHKAGEYFLRVRGVNANGEVSEPSAPEKITVERTSAVPTH